MSKKMMLLALAVAAMFALPAAASAQEAHINGLGTFSGSIAEKGTLQATGEPTITALKTKVEGNFNAGSSTTGTVHLEFTESTASVLGFPVECHTTGKTSGVITTHGTFHVITANNEPKILITPETTTLICASSFRTTVSGNIIGTITSPACGASSKEYKVKFTSTGSTQEPLEYTGVKYDLTAQTENSAGEKLGSAVTAGLTSPTTPLTSSTAGTLECT